MDLKKLPLFFLIGFAVIGLNSCNVFTKNALLGTYEPESGKSGLVSNIEFKSDGVYVIEVGLFGVYTKTTGQYTISGKTILTNDSTGSMAFFEIRDSKTLVTFPVPLLFDEGEIWKKKK